MAQLLSLAWRRVASPAFRINSPLTSNSVQTQVGVIPESPPSGGTHPGPLSRARRPAEVPDSSLARASGMTTGWRTERSRRCARPYPPRFAAPDLVEALLDAGEPGLDRRARTRCR